MTNELRRKILELLEQHRTMTIATLRPDGWPQATTVGYVSEDLTIWYADAPASSPPLQMPTPDQVALFRVVPEVISVLDYSKGFGHTDLVACTGAAVSMTR